MKPNPGNTWFINFNGIGNGIIIAPILACFEKSFPDIRYFHTQNEVLSTKWFTSKANVTNLAGFSPLEWRRFSKQDWDSIVEFIRENNINQIVNLRNEGPAYDKEYYLFKEYSKDNPVEFIDLDFKVIMARTTQKNLTADILALLETTGTDVSSYDSKWLSIDKPARKGIGFGMAGSHKNKRWPLTKWVTLGKEVRSLGKELILFPGTLDEEIEGARRVKEAIGLDCEIVEQESLVDVIERIRNLELFVGNDTGLLHTAAASNIYTIGIYTCTDPDVWAPLIQDKFTAFINKNFVKCSSRKMHCGNCFHYYDICPAIANSGDDIQPELIGSFIKEINRKGYQ